MNADSGNTIKQLVKDIRFLIADKCTDETIQARIEDYAKEKAIEFGKYVWKIDTVEAENKGLNLFDLGWEKFIEKAYQKFNEDDI